MKITTIPIDYTLDDMYEELEESKGTYIKHEMLYYPYLIFEATVEAQILTRLFSENICCWIDLATGREALAQPVEGKEIIEVEEKRVVKEEISREGLKAKARSYINFALFSKMKILKTPEIDIIKTTDIYRPFYILQFQKENEKRTAMVDGISGEHYILRI